MKKCYPLSKDLYHENRALDVAEKVLSMMLKSKVRSGSAYNRLSVIDKRRIETYLPILNNTDWYMKEELKSELYLYLLENDSTFELFVPTYGEIEIQFYDDCYVDVLRFLSEYMGKHLQNIGYTRIQVNKLDEKGNIMRYPLTEKDIADGRKTGRPMKKEYTTILKLDVETEKGILQLDSETYRNYLTGQKYDKKTFDDLGKFLRLVKSKVKEKHFEVWYKYHMTKKSERSVLLETFSKKYGVKTKSLYVWIKKVDNVVKEIKKAECKQVVGYNTNYIGSDSSQGKINCCAYIPSFDGKEKGYSRILENDNCVVSDSAIGCIDWKINTTEKDCVDTFLSVEKVGLDWKWLIDNSEFTNTGYNVEVKKNKAIKYIPKKTCHGQGTHFYDDSIQLLSNKVNTK